MDFLPHHHAFGTKLSPSSTSTLRLVLLRFLDALAGNVYRTLIVTRTDHLYACAHPIVQPPTGAVWIQHGQGAEVHGPGSVSDRHVVCHFDDRWRVHAVLPWLVRALPTTLFAPEIILGSYWETQRLTIHRFVRVAFTVRQLSVSTHGLRSGDASRWNAGAGGSLPCRRGLLVKYVEEHSLAVTTCRADPCSCEPALDHPIACASVNLTTCRGRNWARQVCAGRCSAGCFSPLVAAGSRHGWI